MSQSKSSFRRHVALQASDYILTKRREEAFDLSGPYLPRPLHPPLRQATLINFPVTQDRALKHFYDDVELRQFLTHFGSENIKKEKSSEVKRMRHSIEDFLTQACKEQRSGMQIQYVVPTIPRRAKITPVLPQGWQINRAPQGFHGKFPLLRSTVDTKLTRGEASRILDNLSSCLVEFNYFLKQHEEDEETGGNRGKKERAKSKSPSSTPKRNSAKPKEIFIPPRKQQQDSSSVDSYKRGRRSSSTKKDSLARRESPLSGKSSPSTRRRKSSSRRNSSLCKRSKSSSLLEENMNSSRSRKSPSLSKSGSSRGQNSPRNDDRTPSPRKDSPSFHDGTTPRKDATKRVSSASPARKGASHEKENSPKHSDRSLSRGSQKFNNYEVVEERNSQQMPAPLSNRVDSHFD